MANYPEEGLLRNSRREEERFGGRHPQGVPQTGAQVPSRRQSRGQIGRGEVQDPLRSQRRSQRSQEAQDLRSGRLLLRQYRPGDRRGLRPCGGASGRRRRFPGGTQMAARAFPSISAASIFPISSTAPAGGASPAAGVAAAAASATFSVRSSAADTARPRPKKAPSPAPTSNIRSTFPSGRRSAAASCA